MFKLTTRFGIALIILMTSIPVFAANFQPGMDPNGWVEDSDRSAIEQRVNLPKGGADFQPGMDPNG